MYFHQNLEALNCNLNFLHLYARYRLPTRKKGLHQKCNPLILLVRPAGFKPAAYGLEDMPLEVSSAILYCETNFQLNPQSNTVSARHRYHGRKHLDRPAGCKAW